MDWNNFLTFCYSACRNVQRYYSYGEEQVKLFWKDFCACPLCVFNFSGFIVMSAIRYTSEEVNPLRWTWRHSEPAAITPPQEKFTDQFCLHASVASRLLTKRPVN
jgi:hypothetical protein